MINGKIHYKSPFSVAMLNYQRVRENLNRKPMGFYHQIIMGFSGENFPMIQFHDNVLVIKIIKHRWQAGNCPTLK